MTSPTVQHVFLIDHEGLCPIDALANMARVVPAAATDPLFSWRDRHNVVRPLVRSAALKRINSILGNAGWGTIFGHSFRIGGATYYLAQGASAEVVRLAGRWRSLAYETYIRAFEQVVSRHLAAGPFA